MFSHTRANHRLEYLACYSTHRNNCKYLKIINKEPSVKLVKNHHNSSIRFEDALSPCFPWICHNIKRVGGATARGPASLQGSKNPLGICVGVKYLESLVTH
jgi:hypothetical protein